MAWKESTKMSSRLEFVHLALKPGANVSELCRQFEISRKTAYKWIERYAAEGPDGLQDKSRRPHTSPASTPREVERMVLDLNAKYPYWGGRKLRLLLPASVERPAPSTIDAILDRNHAEVQGAPIASHLASNRFEHDAPNDLWQMDFKGHFALTDPLAGRCHPLTVLDDHSRYSLCLTACGDERYATVRAALTATFERYGLPQRITADNGPPWGSAAAPGLTQAEVWLITLGVKISHSRPYHPQTQGKDERFHRTLKLELLDRRGFQSLQHCQLAFDEWRDQYNMVRPHQALNGARPISRYRSSGRSFPSTLPRVEYYSNDTVRKVNKDGYVAYKGQHYYVGTGLKSQPVAIRPSSDDGEFDVYFCHQAVSKIMLRNDLKSTTNV